MISRHWHGIAKAEYADRYASHLREETFPHLATLSGFVDAAILKRSHPLGVEFLVITRWTSRAAIEAFAGDDTDIAVVPEAVRRMMVQYDHVVAHYDVLD